MTLRAVYDTMIFVSWAAMPTGRRHATIRALYEGTVKLLMSQEAIDEIGAVLGRPALQAALPRLTPERVEKIIEETLRLAEWVQDVPRAFTWPHHPDDDHIFNLAIAGKADRLVSQENLILDIGKKFPADAARLNLLAPQLQILRPHELAAEVDAARKA